MSPQDIAKDAIRLVTTAGLGKDVIDLLEKKVALLTEKIATLETENANLKQKVENSEKELERLQPKQDRFEEGPEKILRFLFDNDDDDSIMAEALQMNKGKAHHYCDVLYDAGMLGISGPEKFHIVADGRAYVMRYLVQE
jgi:FtsZ-binding cell division protein ZapB